MPLSLHFALAFTGRFRALRLARGLTWAAFLLLSAGSALAFVWAPARAFAGSPRWAILYLCGLLPVLLLVVRVLVLHLRQELPRDERSRARFLFFAIALGSLFGATSLVNDIWAPVPDLAAVGFLLAGGLTSVAALRFQLVERDLAPATTALALLAGVVGLAVHLYAFARLGPRAGVLVLGSLAVSVAVFAVTRSIITRRSQLVARRSQLAFLGRFSAQMAHDLKNPVAALKGAAQFVDEEEARANAPAEKRQLTLLMLDQVQRIESVIDRYQRLSRVEPRPAPLSLNELVSGVLALQPFASGSVVVKTALAPGLALIRLDRDLLAGALENLVRNAFEAMPEGGTVTVRTAREAGGLVLSVEDTGPGMSARVRERAFDEFFTTKANGTGLGLAFVRRVAEAHGGTVTVESAVPQGTLLRLHLPLVPDHAVREEVCA